MNIELIWQEYRGLLKRFLASKVSNPRDAEDLLQNILIKVHQKLSSLNSSDKLKPWLMQIANHTIIDFYRQQAKHKTLTLEDLWYEDKEEVQRDLSLCLSPFIQELPVKYRDLLIDIDINGKKQKDYAQQHEISYSTLKSRVQKGRSELKRLMEQCCEFELDTQGNAIDCTERQTICKPC